MIVYKAIIYNFRLSSMFCDIEFGQIFRFIFQIFWKYCF